MKKPIKAGVDQVIAFIRSQSPEPVTSQTLAKHLGVKPHSVSNLLQSCLRTGKIAKLPPLRLKPNEPYVNRYVLNDSAGQQCNNRKNQNIYHALEVYGHDEDFQPKPCVMATHFRPGTLEKMEVLRTRVELGQEIFHPCDVDFLGVPWSRRFTKGAAS